MNSFKNIKPRTLIKLSILLSILIFFSINIITNNMLASSRIDFTENKLYSLSDGTKSLLKNLNEPIHIRLFISSNLIKDVPQLSTYANRVQMGVFDLSTLIFFVSMIILCLWINIQLVQIKKADWGYNEFN